jgi:hypothetical protein
MSGPADLPEPRGAIGVMPEAHAEDFGNVKPPLADAKYKERYPSFHRQLPESRIAIYTL